MNIYRFVVPVAPDTFPAFVKSIVQIVCLFLLLAHMINRAGVFAGGFIDARIAGTTVAALYVRHVLGFLLDQAGLEPGFLIGGVPLGFSESARLGAGKYFCVEADEYDSAFFDKRSKFVHYHPKTAILNNLEFDHADIFDDLAAIQKQFHHLVRTIPSEGRIIAPITENNIDEVLEMGCWTPVLRTSLDAQPNAELYAEQLTADGSHFNVLQNGVVKGEVRWNMTGQHSVANALATIAAAEHVGVSIETACIALSNFGGVKRRME